MIPFLKWAGGKRWLTSQADSFLPNSDRFNRYFEPFLGGGSIFFHIEPNNALLSDTNADLINTYLVIRDNWSELYKLLKTFNKKHSEDFYYSIRSSKPKTKLNRAARFLYLNRTCFNGLYRVNKKGEFNVPIGTKTNVLLEDDNFEKLSQILQSADLQVCDFEETIDKAEENDFVFVDPPYTVKHNMNGFIKYNENIFSWSDQVRLKAAVTRAINRGAKVLITNANHKSILELYAGCGRTHKLDRASVIAGNSNARGIYSELAIISW